jgi:hypothetical protein
VSYDVEAVTKPDFYDVLAEFTADHKYQPVEVGK